MRRRNLRDSVNAIESFNETLFVPSDANSDNVGDEENDLVHVIEGDHDIYWFDIHSDELTQTLYYPNVCQHDQFTDDEVICDNFDNDMTSTRETVSPGLGGHEHTVCLGDVDYDSRNDYEIVINSVPTLNLYRTGSCEMTCDERFTSCNSEVKPI